MVLVMDCSNLIFPMLGGLFLSMGCRETTRAPKPGPGWNFVFGLASVKHRVGVWSIYRNGNPEESPDAFRTALRRTIKTATHETGHMFSIGYCIAYNCNMCGSNHREESDRHPLYLCPECHAKVHWATGADMKQRFRALRDFMKKHGFDKDAAFYERSLEAISK
jgi:archaemetzincin